MKKILTIILFFACITLVSSEEIEVKFSKCVDGDTAKFIYNNEEITARFLTIDTPETVHPTKEDQEQGKEASNYTCERIKEAKEIILEFDENSPKNDKYGRYLVWIFLDSNLLQKELVKQGLAIVDEQYDHYKYSDELKKIEAIAKENKIGIWNTSSNEEYTKDVIEENEKSNDEIIEENTNKVTSFIEKYKEYIILIGALIIVSMFNLKSKKKVKNKLKNKIKNDIKKRLK